jgi:hypothetical protein
LELIIKIPILPFSFSTFIFIGIIFGVLTPLSRKGGSLGDVPQNSTLINKKLNIFETVSPSSRVEIIL